MVYRYSNWDGTQSIDPLDPDEMLSCRGDLLEEGDLRRALERPLMRGATRSDGSRRRSGMRDVLDGLRLRREDQLGMYDLSDFMSEVPSRQPRASCSVDLGTAAPDSCAVPPWWTDRAAVGPPSRGK